MYKDSSLLNYCIPIDVCNYRAPIWADVVDRLAYLTLILLDNTCPEYDVTQY
jgi:hypothetical protein